MRGLTSAERAELIFLAGSDVGTLMFVDGDPCEEVLDSLVSTGRARVFIEWDGCDSYDIFSITALGRLALRVASVAETVGAA